MVEEHIRTKRSTEPNYPKILMEIQFSRNLHMDRTTLLENVQQMIKGITGKFVTVEDATKEYKVANNITDPSLNTYMKPTFDIEIPPGAELRCANCIKFFAPLTCPNDLLERMKAGYAHSKYNEWVNATGGKIKDAYEVSVGTTVDLYCADYVKKPKRDIWDTDKNDGTLTAMCMPNLEFSMPYDTTSWGSCLAKCPEPHKINTTSHLEVDYEYMEGKDGELWEGEQLVYQ